MNGTTYAVLFNGHVIEGFAPTTVQSELALLLRIDAQKTAALFSGKPIVIKRTPDKAEAMRYGRALKNIGADVSIRIIKTETAVSNSAASAASEDRSPQFAVPDFGLRPNSGNLFDSVDAVVPVTVDISGISLAAQDDSPLAPPREPVSMQPDISALRVLENDSSPLAPPLAPSKKIAAPDFHLDALGTNLSTRKVHAQRAQLDTSRLSLALSGDYLLHPHEHPQPTPFNQPDIRHLSLDTDIDR